MRDETQDKFLRYCNVCKWVVEQCSTVFILVKHMQMK